MSQAVLDLAALGMDRGAHLLVKRALEHVSVGSSVLVRGDDAALAVHLRAWTRSQGHGFEDTANGCRVIRGDAEVGRWRGSERAGGLTSTGVVERPALSWGLSARGAQVEAGAPEFDFDLVHKDEVWTDDAARIYAAAAANQWDPETAIDWTAPMEHPEEVEDAVVQVMTYLIENEMAALLVPARFLARIHPHFREVLQVLSVQMADEARHIEVFTRRATLNRGELGLSTTGGQTSLKTLFDEPDFALATFLLSVLGEGSFLDLLWFLEQYAPDPITRQVAKMAAQDEARHVAFGMAHLARHVDLDPGLLGRLADAIERRHSELQHTAGLNEEVFDSLILLAAGSWSPQAIADGWDKVLELKSRMDRGRQVRLGRLGFSSNESDRLSGLHTRNFM